MIYDNLAHYYECEEASGNLLDAHGELELTATGTPAGDTGIVGNARVTSSTAYFTTAQKWVSSGSEMSTSFWMYWTSGSGQYPIFQITSTNVIELSVNLFDPGGGFVRSGLYTLNLPATVTKNEWHHLVIVTGPGTDNRLYYDGALQDQETAVSPHNFGSAPAGSVWVGRRNTGFAFLGSVDEIAIWNRSLTEDEVVWLYNDGAGRTYEEVTTIPYMEELVYERLSSDTNITDIVGARIFPVFPTQDTRPPLLVYQKVESDGYPVLTGLSDLSRYQFTIDYWGVNSDTCLAIGRAITSSLDGWRNLEIGVQGAFLKNTIQASEERGFHGQQLYEIFAT